MTNVWRRKPLTINPYHETAFQVLGLTPDVTARTQIGQRAEERRQAANTLPGFFRLGDRTLTAADVTSAREILMDPNKRIQEELLEHHPEMLPTDQIRRIAARLTPPEAAETSVGYPANLGFLVGAAQELAMRKTHPGDVDPIPPDVHLIPPFGLPETSSDDRQSSGDSLHTLSDPKRS